MANTPPSETESPNVPPEMIEQILLNLPLKSLLRFSCVSPSWNSILTSPRFIARRWKETVVINCNPWYFDVGNAFCATLFAVAYGGKAQTELSRPIRKDMKLKAFCDELWCVAAKRRLYLWNPSTGESKKLEDAPPMQRWFPQPPRDVEFVYGLGYDAVDDDYKLLKIFRRVTSWIGEQGRCLLYSLKSDSWKEIQGFLHADFFPDCNGLSVNGALHWIAISNKYANWHTLVSFDFSAEEFRVLQQPVYDPKLVQSDVVDVAVLREKLCVFLNYRRRYYDSAFVLWAMEDYGCVDSWTKLYEIRYDSIPSIASEFSRGVWSTVRPLYVYEDGRVVIWASISGCNKSEIIVYKGREFVRCLEIEPSGSKVVDASKRRRRVRDGFVYVKSLVSPNMWGNGTRL